MTLKTRNLLLLGLFFVSLLLTFLYTGAFIFALLNDAIIPPDSPMRYISILENVPGFAYDYKASFVAIAVFIIYVPITSYILWNGFEKTQSSEVVYFSLFLLSCLSEGSRLSLPLFGLWKSYSLFFVFIGRLVFAGRFLAPCAFILAALFSETEQRQDVDRNCILGILLAIFVAILVPLDTSVVTSSCTIWWGYRTLFVVMRVFLYILTFVTILLNAYKKDSAELKANATGFIILILGYSLLQASDNFVTLCIAFLLFVAGTAVYLRSLHSRYLWN